MIGAAFLDYLINALWQAPLLGLGAWALVRLTGLGPAGRHRVWLACLVLAVVLPTISLLPFLPDLSFASASDGVATPVVMTPELLAALAKAPPPTPTMLQVDSRLAWGLAALFAVAVLIGLARLVAGWHAVRRLLKDATLIVLPSDLQAELNAFAWSQRTSMPQIRASAQVAGPAVAGAFRTTILVPEGFDRWPQAEVRAALLHELSHVARRDYAVNLASEVLALPLCWHPALHLILAEVRRSRELVCDAMASAAMRSQKAYARSLVSLAGAIDPAQTEGASAAVGLFGKSLLEERLMHLIGPKRSTAPALKMAGLIAGVAVAAGVVGAASLLHVNAALAQSAPPVEQVVAEATGATPADPAVAAVAATAVADSDQADASQDRTDQTIIVDSAHQGHKHKWVSHSGKAYTVINGEERELTPEEQAKLEKDIAKATAEAAKAAAMVNSPEFKAKIAEATAKAAKAEAMVNSREFKAKIAEATAKAAQAEAMVNSAEFKAKVDKAMAKAAKAQAFVNSPEFQAQIAEATAKAAKAEAMVNSPEYKAKIERAERLERSPEWRKAKDDLRRAADRLRELEEQDRDQ